MTEIQNKLLAMMNWFSSFCKKNNLTYYVYYGTFLGTVRHNGFIPWDDDIDVAMPRPDYNRLISLINDKEIDGYILKSPYSSDTDYYDKKAKLYDTATTVIEKSKHPVARGLFIDIFPIDGLGNSIKEAKAFIRKVRRRNMFLAARNCEIRKDRSLIKNASILMASMIPSCLVNERKLTQKLDKLASSNQYAGSQYVGSLMSYCRERDIFEKTLFDKVKDYKFESYSIQGIEDYEKYLKQVYGDWTTLPKESERKSGHEFIFIDLNMPYKSYNSNTTQT